MKKTLIAVAAVAVSMGAMAQNVTLSGTISASYQKDLSGAITAAPVGQATTGQTLTAKGLVMTDASFKMTATEDLGGGLKASADYAVDGPAARGGTFTRADGGISVAGGFGTVAYRNTRTSDLIAGIGSSAIALPDGVYDTGVTQRGAIDLVSYTFPTLVKGLSLGLTYLEGNDGNQSVPSANTKTAYVLSGSYAMGPLTLSAQAKTLSLDALSTSKKNQLELAATYDAGIVKVAVAHDGRESTTRGDALGLSATVPMGALSFGAQYFKRDATKMTEFGARYDLTKRTNFTASTGKVTARSNSAFQENGTQYRLRLSHSF